MLELRRLLSLREPPLSPKICSVPLILLPGPWAKILHLPCLASVLTATLSSSSKNPIAGPAVLQSQACLRPLPAAS